MHRIERQLMGKSNTSIFNSFVSFRMFLFDNVNRWYGVFVMPYFSVEKLDMIYLKSTGSMLLGSLKKKVGGKKKCLKLSWRIDFFFFADRVIFLFRFCTCLFMHMSDMSRRLEYCNFICAHFSLDIIHLLYVHVRNAFHVFFPLSLSFHLFLSIHIAMNKLIKTETTFQESSIFWHESKQKKKIFFLSLWMWKWIVKCWTFEQFKRKGKKIQFRVASVDDEFLWSKNWQSKCRERRWSGESTNGTFYCTNFGYFSVKLGKTMPSKDDLPYLWHFVQKRYLARVL